MIWIHENFLKDVEIEELLNISDMKFNHINNKNTKPLMSDTEMSYRICSMEIYKPIYDKLNLLHNLNLSEKTHHLNMQYKKFEEGDYYSLHAENPKIYGDWFYSLNLSDEVDGELIFPSKEAAKKEWSQGFQEMCDQFDVTFKEHTQVHIPKLNTCVVMKTGIAHSVRSCSNSRLNICGWPQFKGPV